MPELETPKQKRYAVVACEDGEKWGGEKGICDSLIEVFGNENQPSESWLSVYAVTGKLPSLDEIRTLDGILMSGSRHSANDDKEWVHNLEEFVCNATEIQKERAGKLKVVGLCFAHQLIAKAMGGNVASNPSGNFVVIAENVKVKEELKRKPYFQESLPPNTDVLTLLESHGEAVTELAPKSLSIASSTTCDNEIVLYGEDTITFQSHPELTVYDIEKHILPALKNKSIINDDDIFHSQKTFESSLDSQNTVKMIKRFLGLQVN